MQVLILSREIVAEEKELKPPLRSLFSPLQRLYITCFTISAQPFLQRPVENIQRMKAVLLVFSMKSCRSEKPDSDPGPADTGALLLETATYFSEQIIPYIQSGESPRLGRPPLAPASIFLFVGCTRVEN